MLQVEKQSPDIGVPASERDPAELLAWFVAFVRRRFAVLMTIVAFSLAIGIAYLLMAAPRYTAQAVMLVDNHKVQLFQQQIYGDPTDDSETVDSEIEILKSETVALSVINKLHLTADPEFVGSGGGFFGFILGLAVSSAEPKSDFELSRRAVAVFKRGLAVKRVGLTRAIEIDFQSLDSGKAAQIANAVGEAYIVDELDAKYEASRRTGAWLQDRISELNQQASTAERAVLDFKQANNIVDTGGRLIGEQQLAELNSQLILARAASAEAQARLARIESITQTDIPDVAVDDALRKPDAAVADALHNDVITKLRSQYLDIADREADLSSRLGANHLAVVNLRNQMREIRKSIFDELRRIAETFKSDYDIAKARENSITKDLADAVAQTQSTNKSQVALHELESNSQSYRALYDNFLQRYMESVQQQSFPISDARLISKATRPLGKSAPNPMLVLPIASSGGLLIAFAFAMLLELSDRGFRTTDQVEKLLQVDCVSVVPRLPRLKGGITLPRRDITKSAAKPPAGEPPAGEPPAAKLPAPAAGAAVAVEESIWIRKLLATAKGNPHVVGPRPTGARQIRNDGGVLFEVLNAPFSRFTEAIRALKVAADLNGMVKANKVIGITSALPNEGKSTIAVNFAQLIAHGGGRVILIDGDLRNPALSRKLTRDASGGLLNVVAGKIALHETVWTDPVTGLEFLPLIASARLSHTSELLASAPMKKLIEDLHEAYDYVVIDLPPLTPVVDVRATTQIVDSYLFVVEWGRTRADVVKRTLETAQGVYDRLFGIVLNKADLDSMGRYLGYSHYHNKYYARYGYVE